MGAAEVIHELERHGAIADKEWHGNKPELKTPEERAEEYVPEEENHSDDIESQQWQGPNTNGEFDRFEIEIEDGKSKKLTNGKESNGFDALQRQRTTAQAIF